MVGVIGWCGVKVGCLIEVIGFICCVVGGDVWMLIDVILDWFVDLWLMYDEWFVRFGCVCNWDGLEGDLLIVE